MQENTDQNNSKYGHFLRRVARCSNRNLDKVPNKETTEEKFFRLKLWTIIITHALFINY